MTLILVLALMLVGGAAYVMSEWALTPARRRRQMLTHARAYGDVVAAPRSADPFRERVISPMTRRLAGAALRLQPKTTLGDVRSRLAAAGLLRRISPTSFLAVKMLTTTAGPFLGIAFGSMSDSTARGILLAVVLAIAGWKVPEFILSKRATSRSEQIASDLGRAVDLLAVSVEAGLGFDGALAKLLERLRGPARRRVPAARDRAARGAARGGTRSAASASACPCRRWHGSRRR